MIGLNIHELEILLHRNADRGAAAPDADDELWMKAILENQLRESKRILE